MLKFTKLAFVCFSILILNVFLFAQTQDGNENKSESPKAFIYDEFGNVPNGNVRLVLDLSLVELQKRPDSKIYLVTYGTERNFARRIRLIQNHFYFRGVNSLGENRIKQINGGFEISVRTIVWLVPKGADPPVIEDKSVKVAEFRSLKWKSWTSAFNKAFKIQQDSECGKQLFIEIYGKSSKTINKLIKTFREYSKQNNSKCFNQNSNFIHFFDSGRSNSYKVNIWAIPLVNK